MPCEYGQFFRDFAAKDPAFDKEGDRYNMQTWGGRARYFFETYHPKLILGQMSQMDQSVSLLKRYTEGHITQDEVLEDNRLNRSLWEARTLVESVLHEDGSEMPWYGRFSWFVPINIPICAGMVIYPVGLPQYIGQWVNQSYNVMMNYSNSNRATTDNSILLRNYFFACASSVGIAAALSPVARRYASLGPLVPYTAVAAAGFANICFTRSGEFSNGIEVFSGKVGDRTASVSLGNSQEAGKTAVTQTALTRAILPIPTLLLPPMLTKLAKRTPLANTRARSIAFQVVVVGLCLWIALPVSIAMFPKYTTVTDDHASTGAILTAEQKEKYAASKKANPASQVWYTRGL